MQKGAIDLDIAKQTKDEKIAQEQIKTANDMETLKQNQFATKTQPEIFKMQQQSHKANINNIYSTIAERKQNMFFKDQAYKEQEEAKKVMSDFNEFSLKNPNLKGDELKNAYFKNLDYKMISSFNDPLADNTTQIRNAQKYLDMQTKAAKHLGYVSSGYNAIESNFNPIPKGSNGANSVRNNGVSNVDLAMFNKAQEQNKAIEQEFLNNASKIKQLATSLTTAASNLEDPEIIRQELAKLQERQKELENIKNQNKAYINSNTSGIYTMLKDTLARQGFSKPEEEIQEIQDLLLLSKGLNDIYDVLENGKGKDFNVGYTGNIGRFFTRVGGNSHPVDLLENRTKTFMKIYQNSGTKLKSQYEDIRSVFPDYTGFWQSKGKVASDLRDIEESIRNQINNKLSAYNNESKELIKSLVDNIYTSKYSLKATQ
ncbi:hypothetical protein KJQ97_00825 [Campylobacter sp. 2018MI01]|uniref:hypothetical protein n=1 Tax=Campylobacter sp. 2018MI01 TaxID=2836735 RepID=UPI001BDB1109|nr:hypothetical protein [Campylobacter sp. 2018MI01]MBT0877970.1 hypothetical protein [Campylobacter sp. 2018MI01]